MNPIIARRVNVLRLDIPRPSALPFHLLTWGQRFVMHHNCKVHNDANTVGRRLRRSEDNIGNCDLYPHVRNIKNIQGEHRFVKHNHTFHFPVKALVKYVYYTESDELVYFEDLETLRVISEGSNGTCFFLGRRAERFFDPKKSSTQRPEDYKLHYTQGRFCGKNGFELSFQDSFVRKTA